MKFIVFSLFSLFFFSKFQFSSSSTSGSSSSTSGNGEVYDGIRASLSSVAHRFLHSDLRSNFIFASLFFLLSFSPWFVVMQMVQMVVLITVVWLHRFRIRRNNLVTCIMFILLMDLPLSPLHQSLVIQTTFLGAFYA